MTTEYKFVRTKKKQSRQGYSSSNPTVGETLSAVNTILYEDIVNGTVDKGIFTTPEDLMSTYPIGEPGWFAYVESTQTIWFWNDLSITWEDSGQSSSLTGVGTAGQFVVFTGSSSVAGVTLLPGQTIIGNSSNLAVPVSLSGDITINSAGVTTVKDDVNLGGNPTTTTQAQNDNSTKISTTAYVDTAIVNVENAIDLALNDKIDKVIGVDNEIATFATLGNIVGSGYTVETSFTGSNNTIPTSEAVSNAITDKANKVIGATSGDLAALNASGDLIDSGFKVNNINPFVVPSSTEIPDSLSISNFVTNLSGGGITTVGSSGADYTTVKAAIDSGKTTIRIITNTTEFAQIQFANNVYITVGTNVTWTLPNIQQPIRAITNDGITLMIETEVNGIIKYYPSVANATLFTGGVSFNLFRKTCTIDISGATQPTLIFSNLNNVYSSGITKINLPNLNNSGFLYDLTGRAYEGCDLILNGGGANCANAIRYLAFGDYFKSITLTGTFSSSNPIIDCTGAVSNTGNCNMPVINIFIENVATINFNIGGNIGSIYNPFSDITCNVKVISPNCILRNANLGSGTLNVNNQAGFKAYGVYNYTLTNSVSDTFINGMNLVPSATSGHIATFNSSGQVVDSGSPISTFTPVFTKTYYAAPSPLGQPTNSGFTPQAPVDLQTMLNLLGSSGNQGVIAPGTYTGTFTVPTNCLNANIAGGDGGICNINGTLNINANSTTASNRFSGFAVGTVNLNGTADVYFTRNITVNTAVNKTSSCYFQVTDNSDLQGSTSSCLITITGAGNVNFWANSKVGITVINNAAAVVSYNNVPIAGPITCTAAAVLNLNNATIFSATPTGNAVSISSGTINITNVICVTTSLTPARINIGASSSYVLSSANIDIANSTIAGTNLGATFATNYLTLSAANAYFNTEILTGKTWLNGKPIYRKCYTLTNIDGGSEYTIDATLTNSYITQLIKIEASGQTPAGSGSTWFSANLNDGGSVDWRIYIDSTGLKFLSNVGSVTTAAVLNIIAEYTK